MPMTKRIRAAIPVPHVLTFGALLAAGGVAACKTRAYNTETNAAVGIPQTYLMKVERDPAGREGIYRFTVTQKDAKGLPSGTIERWGLGNPTPPEWGPLLYVRDPDKREEKGNEWGYALVKKDDENYGYVTNTPWRCSAAEEFLTGQAKTNTFWNKNQLCVLEFHTLGTPTDLSIVMIGLNAHARGDGEIDAESVRKGLDTWFSLDPFFRTAKLTLNAGAPLRKVSEGMPERPNMRIDKERVVAAMEAVYKRYADKVDDRTRGTCFNNLLTAETNWLDVQVHYWCQFPLDATRLCYIKALRGAKEADDAAGNGIGAPSVPILAKRDSLRRYHQGAYEKCLAAKDEALVWIDKEWKQEFFYIMWAVQFLSDFNLSSEQEAINEFYARIGRPRPRRVVDTYPSWLPEQPRYGNILKRQLALSAAWPVMVEMPYAKWAEQRKAAGQVVPEPVTFPAKGGSASAKPATNTPSNPDADKVNLNRMREMD